MTLLELITKATSDKPTSDSQYPLVLNPPNPKTLIPNTQNNPFLKPFENWSLSQQDTQIISLSQNFYKTLKTKLKQNTNTFTKHEFISYLTNFIEKLCEKTGISKNDNLSKNFEKVGLLMGEGVLGLVLEGSLVFEIWEVVENLVVCGLVNGSSAKGLVCTLVEKRKAELVCLCVKHITNLEVFDTLAILRFFLSSTRDGYASMVVVREEWERETVKAIEMGKDKKLSLVKDVLVKDVLVLLMMGHDEFTANESCLHYLVASQMVDDVIFSACIGKLNGVEIMRFVRYLKKWLGKYQKFPQACLSSTKCLSLSGLKCIESVPSLENVTKCFGLVIDEHFSSLVMHPEFCEEVKSVELIVNSLASEARLCCTLASLCASLKI